MQAYAAGIFRFRECIEAESEREVRQTNELLDEWRCKVSKKECRIDRLFCFEIALLDLFRALTHRSCQEPERFMRTSVRKSFRAAQ